MASEPGRFGGPIRFSQQISRIKRESTGSLQSISWHRNAVWLRHAAGDTGVSLTSADRQAYDQHRDLNKHSSAGPTIDRDY
jgi:hypothetical protein